MPESVEDGFIPKGKIARDIPLLPDVEAALAEWKPNTDGTGRLFSGVNWRRWAAAIRKRSKVRFRWHLLRHTAASRLVMAGVNLRAVQAIMGHASITTTERYAHLAPNAFDDVRLRLPMGITWGRDQQDPTKAALEALKTGTSS